MESLSAASSAVSTIMDYADFNSSHAQKTSRHLLPTLIPALAYHRKTASLYHFAGPFSLLLLLLHFVEMVSTSCWNKFMWDACQHSLHAYRFGHPSLFLSLYMHMFLHGVVNSQHYGSKWSSECDA